MDMLTRALVGTESRAAGAGAPARAEVDSAMERYAVGDDASFAVVYDGIAPRLYGYLLRHTRNRALAEDLVQQTMLHIHRARGRFIVGAAVTPWSFAIARRLLLDDVRHAKREGTRAEGDPDALRAPLPSADELVDAGELAARIRGALDKLPESQRVAFELVKEEGLSVVEAAGVLGTTVAGVKLRVHRAKVALRLALGDAIASTEGP